MSNSPDTTAPPQPSKEVELLREKAKLVAAGPGFLTGEELWRRCQTLAKSKLVPKALEDNPEGIFLVASMGMELGVSPTQALSEIHVIEGRPSPSAQLRLSLIRRHGHEARFVETSDEKAVIRGRRSEDVHDPEGWVTVEWTIEQARKAGLVDRWVERKYRNQGDRFDRTEKFVVGDDRGIFDEADRRRLGLPVELPEWVVKELEAGKVKTKDNWQKYPADMLRARAASALFRMHFGDVVLAAGVDELTPEERGIDTRLDVDETAHEHDPDDDIVDGEIVEPAPPSSEGPKLSGPATIAVELKKRGIEDRDVKMQLVSAIVDRPVESTKDLTAAEVGLVLRTIDYCESTDELLAVIDEPGPGMDALREKELGDEQPEPAEEFEVDDDHAPIDGPAETESPGPSQDDPAAPARDEPTGPVTGWSDAAWRKFLSARSVKVTELLKEAQRLAREDEADVPTTLGDLHSCSGSLLEVLVGYVEEVALQRSGS